MSAVETRTIPWSWYTDPAVLEIERERIFRRSWQYVARQDEVAESGSFVATRVGDVPVVLVRDEEGTLRAFLNVCRHRGSLVCEGSGKRATLQCPYHAWTYGLDGKLVAAPRFAREGGTDHERLGLVQLSLDTWGPLVFVNPDVDAAPLAEFLEDAPAKIAQAGIDLDALRFTQRYDVELDANWKISAENFLECYHCSVAHPGFSAVMDVSPDAYLLETQGGRMTQHSAPRTASSTTSWPRTRATRGSKSRWRSTSRWAPRTAPSSSASRRASGSASSTKVGSCPSPSGSSRTSRAWSSTRSPERAKGGCAPPSDPRSAGRGPESR